MEYKLWVNSFQGDNKKVLCICTAGLLRSPTAAWVLSNEPYNFNTRSCGINTSVALIPVTIDLIEWANEIVCMNEDIYQLLRIYYPDKIFGKVVHNLNIPDQYAYRDPELIELIRSRYGEVAIRS